MAENRCHGCCCVYWSEIMLYLILAILTNSLLSIIMRLGEGRVRCRNAMFAANYFVCSAMAVGFMGAGNLIPSAARLPHAALLGVINGVVYLSSLMLMQKNIHLNGVVLPSVFSRIGALIVPLIVSILCFGDTPTWMQLAGFMLAVAAILLINYRRDGAAASSKILLLALLLIDGVVAIMSMIFNKTGNIALSDHFLFFTFFSACMMCVALIVKGREKPALVDIGFGVLFGLPNFLSSKFLLKALESVAPVIVYPMRSVVSIVIITLTGVLLFREKLTKRQLVAMGIILVSLVLLNI